MSHNQTEQINEPNQSTNWTCESFQNERMEEFDSKKYYVFIYQNILGSAVMSYFFIHNFEN